ncbi:Tetratricopeptide-like helical protein [Lasiodiplodia theobromae]|uniref:Tetratricopeptide-like helical protein n=1 Tax=Lasiodiplodia theobromae TaxID=45133 RepID=UPI0015C3A7FB|nr:Tetratricopeptide-like helical protein [Lasiodiplodia theobromae]KAF4539813.1 Tetratricopeptide-like helical protein [Lasiodiplodia theobromae]
MAEAFGVAASAIAVAELGFKLTKNIAGYLNDVSTARQQLEGITSNVDITAQTIEQVGSVFNNQDFIASAKPRAMEIAMKAIQICKKSFEEIGEEIEKAQKFYGFVFPLKVKSLKRLGDVLESYKSTLMLLMLILQHSKEMRTDQELRAKAKEYLRLKSEAESRIREAAREEEAGLAEEVSGEDRGIPLTCQESNKSSRETKAESDQIDTTSAKDSGKSPTTPEYLQTFTIPTAPGPGNNHLFLAAIKEDTPADRDATTPTSQHVTEAQLADCIESLNYMICKIELLQQALPTISSISKCLEDNRIPEAASNVKKKLDAIVNSSKQQQETEPSTEDTKTDHSELIGRGTHIKTALRWLQSHLIHRGSSVNKPASGASHSRYDIAVPFTAATNGTLNDVRSDTRNDETTGHGTTPHAILESSINVASSYKKLSAPTEPGMYYYTPAKIGSSQKKNSIVSLKHSTGGEIDALLKEWTTVYD